MAVSILVQESVAVHLRRAVASQCSHVPHTPRHVVSWPGPQFSTLSFERTQDRIVSGPLQRDRQLHISRHNATTSPAGARIDSSAKRGPQAVFQAQLESGTLRSDPRQVAAIQLLQNVYTQLEKLYPKKKKPSNLTMVANVSTKSKRSAWCVCSHSPSFEYAYKGKSVHNKLSVCPMPVPKHLPGHVQVANHHACNRSSAWTGSRS